ncbi:MAG: serine/threonine protein kinase, partial [Actinomycetia bacterium]|nr:serine/threonine protein kinase [Actinomycetes bacterium]
MTASPCILIPTPRPVVEGHTVDLGIAGLGPAVRIGSGGFADVYRAEQTNLRREVAVKVLRAAAGDDDARMRFQRECYAVGAVSSHPSIVAVHEGGFTSDGRAYLVMEYCPGGSLLDRIEQYGPLPADEVIEIGTKIGRALGVAHDSGVLHRDVKPANILVTAHGEPALADFGIARVEGGQQTATGLVTASFTHAAPEVLQGGPPSPASDLYSLGSTMFALFTGLAPHSRPGDDSAWALMHRVVSEPIPDPASVGMVDPLASVVRIVTAPHPEQRFQTAGDLVSALSAPGPVAVTGSAAPPRPVAAPGSAYTTAQIPVVPTLTPSPSVATAPVETVRQPSSRKGLVRGLVLVLILGAIGAGAVGWLTLQDDEPLPDLVFSFPAGATGPLDEGESYELSVQGGHDATLYRLFVDGEPAGQPSSPLEPFIARAGRHSVAVEV